VSLVFNEIFDSVGPHVYPTYLHCIVTSFAEREQGAVDVTPFTTSGRRLCELQKYCHHSGIPSTRPPD
jgi:hypothetical protein